MGKGGFVNKKDELREAIFLLLFGVACIALAGVIVATMLGLWT